MIILVSKRVTLASLICYCYARRYGCCADGETEATGPDFSGCPEHSTSSKLNLIKVISNLTHFLLGTFPVVRMLF